MFEYSNKYSHRNTITCSNSKFTDDLRRVFCNTDSNGSYFLHLDAGCDAFLVKPLDPITFGQQLADCIGEAN